MILSCPSCAAQFNINPQALGEAGRTVRCGKCKHQWHATAPLITLEADDLSGVKASGVSKAAPTTPPETAGLTKGVGQNAIAGSTTPVEDEPPIKSSFTQTSFADAALNEEEALSSMPPYSSEMAPIARRNAVIAAVLLASLLSIPIFLINQSAPPDQPTTAHEEAQQKTMAEDTHHQDKHAEKKEDREIVLDGTPTTLLKEEVGRTILSIEGALINKTQKTLPVPVLQAQALNAKGKVVKEWIIPIANKEMNPGERQTFSYSMPFSEQGVVDIAFHFL